MHSPTAPSPTTTHLIPRMATDSGWSSLFRPQCYCPFSLFTDDDDRSCEKFIPPRTTDIELPQRINWVFSSASLSFRTLFLPLKYRGSHCPHLSLSVCVLTLVTLPCMQIYRTVERRPSFFSLSLKGKRRVTRKCFHTDVALFWRHAFTGFPFFYLTSSHPRYRCRKRETPNVLA